MTDGKQSMKSLRKLLAQTVAYDAYIILRATGLRQLGWFRSLRKRKPIDRNGRPLPWYTYAAINFLEARIHQGMTVFEYGCGSSTLWYAARVGSVVSVEHDHTWYERVKRELPHNVELVKQDLCGGDYPKEATGHGRLFDLIVIDGRERNRCAMACVEALAEDGVVIWDDTDRPDYETGMAFLEERGFRRIDFRSLGPGSDLVRCTSVFYRPANCLGI